MGILLQWFSMAVAVWVVAAVLPGVHLKNFWTGIGVAAVYGLINVVLGFPLRLFLSILSLPVIILTLGLFALVVRVLVNTVVLWVTDRIIEGIKIDGLGWTFAASVGISVVSHGLALIIGGVGGG